MFLHLQPVEERAGCMAVGMDAASDVLLDAGRERYWGVIASALHIPII